MSSPNRSTSDIEEAFSSKNILNYTLVSPDYFPASSGSSSFNSLENSNDNMIPPVFSSFYNNTYLKDVQAFYAKELPISSPDPITSLAIFDSISEPIDDVRCRWCTCERCVYDLRDGFCLFCNSRDGNSFAYDQNPNSFNDSQNLSDYPPQPQYQMFSCELCGNDAHYGYDCPPQVLIRNAKGFIASLGEIFEIQHAQPEDIQELLYKLLKNLQIIREELAEYINSPSWNRPAFYEDDDKDEYTIQYREYLENSSNEITPVLPIKEPDNSLSMADEHLSTIPETESDKVTKSSVEDLVPIPSESEGISNDMCDVPFCNNSPLLHVLNDHFEIFSDCTSSDDDSFEDIDYVEASPPDSELVSLEEVKEDILHEKLLNINHLIACDLPSSDDFSPISIFEEKYSSVEDLVPIPSESEDTSDNDNECDVLVCDDSSPFNVSKENPVIFSNPLFDLNDDFTSSDDESLPVEDVSEDNVKIYSNPLFEFNDEYISSDVNPLFNKVLEDIENKDSYEPALLVTPLSDANKDECFDPGGDIDEIDAFLDIDVSTDVEDGYHDSEGDIIYFESLLMNNTIPNLPSEVFLDHDPRSLKDEPNFVYMVQVFDPGIHEKSFSLTFVKLTFEDRHYFPITFVIRIFLPYLTYSVDSSFLLSSGSEDTIFDPGISTFHFSSLKPVAYVNPMVIFPFFCFYPKDKGIRGESS
ncbi:hypothetical protein Tco_0079239 [Tanacetum coccineum]